MQEKKMIAHVKRFGLATLMAVFLSFSAQAYADTITLNLTQESLTNVDDSAGRWQHEGGKVFLEDNQIGNYALTRRVTNGGTDEQNTAMLTMTIFVLEQNPPQNITLQGSHDFDSGDYIGSVSAASKDLSILVGESFSGSSALDTLTITLP